MAYGTKYRVQFTNENSEEVVILFRQKDSVDQLLADYAATSVRTTYDGDDTVMNTICGCSIAIKFWMQPGDVNCLDDFADAEKNDWMCVATCDGQPIFHGFVLIDEGTVPAQDLPFEATVTATHGLGLLKNTKLQRSDGSTYVGSTNLVINYVASCLLQTGLVLPIRVYDNVFHKDMLNRDDDPHWTWMEQAKLEYRTFLSDATTFVDCYTALQILFTDTHRIHYWSGEWVITRIPTLQYFPYVNYYTLYDYNGLNGVGYEVFDDYGTVGKNELIFPHSEDQNKSLKLAVKSTKTTRNYNVWPEIPLNNKFDRGDQIGTGTAYDEYDLDGDGNTTEVIGTYTTYKIDGWNFRKNVSGYPRPTDGTTSAAAYRKIVKNEYGIELLREVILEAPNAADVANANNLWCDGIPVVRGDKMSVTFDYRLEISGNGTFRPVTITLLGDDGSVWYMNSRTTTSAGPFYWNSSASSGYIPIFYDPTDNVNKYHSYTISADGEFPVNGKIYIGLSAQGVGASARFKNFDFSYHAFVAGGYLQVTGDSWTQEQSKNYPDTTETEVFISDNTHLVFKGTILNMAGVPTVPSWYRMGVSESLHYTQITNLGRFNLEYRRFWFVEGSFKGIKWAPSNDQENQQPITLHKQYRLVDIPNADRRFILTMPLEIDVVKSWMTARFWEVAYFNPVVQNKVETVDHLILRIRDAIDNTTEAQWNSGVGGAPAHGTPGYPPTTFDDGFWLTGTPNAFGVLMNAANDMSATAVNIGAVHIPTINKYYNTTFTGTDGFMYRLMLFQIGSDIRVGDVFTFTAYGFDVGVSVINVPYTFISDGLQFGDVKNEFKYNF